MFESNSLNVSRLCYSKLDPVMLQQTGATLFAEVQQEQARKDANKLNLVVKGTKPSDLKTDATLVDELAETLDVKIEASDVELKRIGKPQESTGHQLLLLKIKEQIKR